MMKTVLLTGFEPFGGERVNPSAEIVGRLHGEMIARHRVKSAVLPCVFGARKLFIAIVPAWRTPGPLPGVPLFGYAPCCDGEDWKLTPDGPPDGFEPGWFELGAPERLGRSCVPRCGRSSWSFGSPAPVIDWGGCGVDE